MTDEQIAEIAGKLTEAQKRYLCERAEWRKPTAYDPPRWMTFPPPSTHRALMRLELVDGCGQIRTSGLAVRNYLENSRGTD